MRERLSVKLVVFDLDGTLVNSRAMALEAIKRGRARFAQEQECSLPAMADDTIAGLIGLPAPEFYPSLLPAHLAAHWHELHRMVFAEEYVLIEAGWSTLFPGTIECLKNLHERGIACAIVSNCTPGYLESNTRVLGLSQWMRHMECVGAHVGLNKTQVLRMVLEREGNPPAVMVGDRVHDIEAAQACGIGGIFVSSGYGPLSEGAGAWTTLGSVAELPGVIA